MPDLVFLGLLAIILLVPFQSIVLHELRLRASAWEQRRAALLNESSAALQHLQDIATSYAPEQIGERFRAPYTNVHAHATARRRTLTSASDALRAIRAADFPPPTREWTQLLVPRPFELGARLVWWWHMRTVQQELARVQEVNQAVRAVPHQLSADIERAKSDTQAIAARWNTAQNKSPRNAAPIFH